MKKETIIIILLSVVCAALMATRLDTRSREERELDQALDDLERASRQLRRVGSELESLGNSLFPW